MDAVKEGRELIDAAHRAAEALKAAATRDAENKAKLEAALAKLNEQGSAIPVELETLAADFDAAEKRINEALAALNPAIETAVEQQAAAEAPTGEQTAEQPSQEAPPQG